MSKGLIQFLIGMLVMTPVSVMTSQWTLLHIFILILFCITAGIFVFMQECRHYLPIAFAFVLSLCIGIAWGFLA